MMLFSRSKNHGSIPVNFAIESTLEPLRKDASKAQSRVSVAVKSIDPPDCQDGSSQSVDRYPNSSDRIALFKSPSKQRSIAITSPVAFI